MTEIAKALSLYLPENEAERTAKAIESGIPVMIEGIEGPTGKTTLCEWLRSKGFGAFEPWELTDDCADLDRNSVCITITLNRICEPIYRFNGKAMSLEMIMLAKDIFEEEF